MPTASHRHPTMRPGGRGAARQPALHVGPPTRDLLAAAADECLARYGYLVITPAEQCLRGSGAALERVARDRGRVLHVVLSDEQ